MSVIKNYHLNLMVENEDGGFTVWIENKKGFCQVASYSDLTLKFHYLSGSPFKLPKYLQIEILKIASKKGYRVNFHKESHKNYFNVDKVYNI